MTKQIKRMAIVLIMLVIALLINNFIQRKTIFQSERLFSIDEDKLTSIEIIDGKESIKLLKEINNWRIVGHDSLVVKKNLINNFLNIVKNVERGSLVSEKISNWDKYNVGDSTGTWLIINDLLNTNKDTIIVGSSSSNWSINNIRILGNDNVYQLDRNIKYNLNVNPNYWGEVPAPSDTLIMEDIN